MASSSFTVSHCGAPSISVTSVPLVPPSARSACPQGARRIHKAAGPPTAAQPLRAALAVVGADAFIGPLRRLSSHRPAAAKRGAGRYPRPPRAKGFPKGRAFPSLTAVRDSQPSPRRRQEVRACADRPAEALFLFHRARRILFLALPKREWGAHPCGNSRPAASAPPEGRLFTSPFPPESGTPYSKRRIPSSEIVLLICDTASSSRTGPRS